MKQYFIIIFLALMIFACGQNNNQTSRPETTISAKKTDGKELFLMRCTTCHGTDGNAGLAGSAKLGSSKYTVDQIVNTIKNGQKAMPKVDLESEEEYQALADYVLTLRK
ncbi:MAG: cytochrome c [Bacteroidota bacterium]|nr:cytochrome c [Bacteroidota bacterium]